MENKSILSIKRLITTNNRLIKEIQTKCSMNGNQLSKSVGLVNIEKIKSENKAYRKAIRLIMLYKSE